MRLPLEKQTIFYRGQRHTTQILPQPRESTANYNAKKILHDTLPSASGTERHYMDSQRPAVIGDLDELYHITVRQWPMSNVNMEPKTPHKHTQKNKTIPEIRSWWWKHCWTLRTWRLIWWHERRSIIKNTSINRTKKNRIIF